MNLKMLFNAGRVRRWHSNPDMSWTDDYNDAHQGRVARLILFLNPKPSVFLLAEALTHDDGELRAGDMTRDTKNANPELRAMVRQVEKKGRFEIWGNIDDINERLTPTEIKWLELCDKLDAHCWMLHKNPSLRKLSDWVKERSKILLIAEELGCEDSVVNFFWSMEQPK